MGANNDNPESSDKLPVLIQLLITAPGTTSTNLLNDNFEPKDNSFWVDWGEEEVYIVEACATALGKNNLVAELVRSESITLQIKYDGTLFNYPLDQSETAQHTTLVRLNEVLSPKYQIRYIWDSQGSDTAAMAVLSHDQWKELERVHGKENVERAFLQFTEKLNILSGKEQIQRP